MRASDAILAADLREAGLTELAARAEAGEWNDYFGLHAMPQHHLIDTLKNEPRVANVVRKRLIANIVDGVYDGTAAEAEEWAASPEGRATFAELPPTVRKMWNSHE